MFFDRAAQTTAHEPTVSGFLIYNPLVLPRNLCPIQLSRRTEPFDSDQFIFELKVDGFRALAHIETGKGELISRNGNVFRGFADLAAWIAEHLRVESAVLMARLPASMNLAGQSLAICFSAVVSACSSRSTCSTSTAKICGCCRSSSEKQC